MHIDVGRTMVLFGCMFSSFLSENIAIVLGMVLAREHGKQLRSKVEAAHKIIVTNTGYQQSYIHDFIQ